MTSEADLVELTTVSTAFDGEWLVGALKTYDITAVPFGEILEVMDALVAAGIRNVRFAEVEESR